MLPIDQNTILNFLFYSFFYLLFAVPLTLSYRTTKVINFAHANFITYGAYVAVFLNGLLGNKSLLLASLLAFLVSGTLAIVSYFFVFKPLEKRGASMSLIMISSMGLWIMYNYLLYMLADIAHFFSGVNFVSYGRILYSDVPEITIGSLRLSSGFVAVCATAVGMSLFFYIFLNKTSLGKAMRAVADNPVLAEISGIQRDKVITFTWLITGGVVGVGGAIWTSFSGTVTPTTGDAMILQVFTIAFIGGLVSLLRTGIGAFVIALIENVGISLLNAWFGVPTSFRTFLTFVALLVILIAFPPLGAAGGLPFRYRKKRGGAK
jgi:branched-chain amino acid transport system permease protein